jgi:hypothetical protein
MHRFAYLFAATIDQSASRCIHLNVNERLSIPPILRHRDDPLPTGDSIHRGKNDSLQPEAFKVFDHA